MTEINSAEHDYHYKHSDFELPSLNSFINTPKIHPIQRENQITLLLILLCPSVLFCLIIWPISFLLTLIPITLWVGLPTFLISTMVLIFFLAWIPYLLYAQDDLPYPSPLLLPISPIKTQRIVMTMMKHLVMIFKLNWFEIVLDYSYRKLIVIRAVRTVKNPMVKCDIAYAFPGVCRKQIKRLDVYLPPSFQSDHLDLTPVFVFIHPGGWRWFDKSFFLQLGLRFRRLGFCVVIPDFTQFPEGRCQNSIQDISCALKWVSRSIGQYGGDPSRIFLAGHGSGAHLALLTVLESSIKKSLSEYSFNKRSSDRGWRGVEENIEAIELPRIEGMILLAGIYDPINQLRDEVRAGWHQILTTRRAVGPTHSITMSNSPAHLLHKNQGSIKRSYLPSKFLIIHGGQDRNVPILQSHLLSKLLENINLQSHETSSRSSKPSSFNSSLNSDNHNNKNGNNNNNHNHKSNNNNNNSDHQNSDNNKSNNNRHGINSNNNKSMINYNDGSKPGSNEIRITFKAFKNLDHMNCLFALMMNSKSSSYRNANGSSEARRRDHIGHRSIEYRDIIADEILRLLN